MRGRSHNRPPPKYAPVSTTRHATFVHSEICASIIKDRAALIPTLEQNHAPDLLRVYDLKIVIIIFLMHNSVPSTRIMKANSALVVLTKFSQEIIKHKYLKMTAPKAHLDIKSPFQILVVWKIHTHLFLYLPDSCPIFQVQLKQFFLQLIREADSLQRVLEIDIIELKKKQIKSTVRGVNPSSTLGDVNRSQPFPPLGFYPFPCPPTLLPSPS